MPIEDIQYLYENSTKESIVLLIDSNKRDKTKWRGPSEFDIEFPEPFKNVYGVEVLNAAIPRTTFTVDKHNSSLRVYSRKNTVTSPDYSLQFLKFDSIVNDYNSGEKLMAGLVKDFRNGFDSTFSITANTALGDTEDDVASKGYLKLSSAYNAFIIDSKTSTLSKTLGFTLFPISNEGYHTKEELFALDLKMFMVTKTGTLDVLMDSCLHDEATFENVIFDASGDCVVKIMNKKINCGIYVYDVSIDDASITTLDIALKSAIVKDTVKITQIIHSTSSAPHKIVIKYIYLMNNSKELNAIDRMNFFASTGAVSISDRNTTITTDGKVKFVTCYLQKLKIELTEEITNIANGDEMYIRFTNESDVNTYYLQCTYLTTGGMFFIEYDAENMNPFNYIQIKAGTYEMKHVRGKLHLDTALKCKDINHAASMIFKNSSFNMVPPGVLNMITENYVLLRCPDIEAHLRGSYDTNDASPGLALFNIDESGYVRTDTEFYSVTYKEFHPIGKLSKLHFKFQRKTDGQLVDFKGVDVHFILSVKMLNAKKLDSTKMVSSLDPNYNPNYMGFMDTEFDNVESDEEKEADEIKDDHYDVERSLLQLQSNRVSFRDESDYESSQDEDSDDSDDSDDSVDSFN